MDEGMASERQPKRKRRHVFSEEEKKMRKRARASQMRDMYIFVGKSISRWNEMKKELGFTQNPQLARYLLDHYEATKEMASTVLTKSPDSFGNTTTSANCTSTHGNPVSGKVTRQIAMQASVVQDDRASTHHEHPINVVSNLTPGVEGSLGTGPMGPSVKMETAYPHESSRLHRTCKSLQPGVTHYNEHPGLIQALPGTMALTMDTVYRLPGSRDYIQPISGEGDSTQPDPGSPYPVSPMPGPVPCMLWKNSSTPAVPTNLVSIKQEPTGWSPHTTTQWPPTRDTNLLCEAKSSVKPGLLTREITKAPRSGNAAAGSDFPSPQQEYPSDKLTDPSRNSSSNASSQFNTEPEQQVTSETESSRGGDLLSQVLSRIKREPMT
ncbi:uncharacterized protein [Littorina saxatilis]|uniref:uncharacterized protein isoform X2 n=1 Tax=Littorina saxatilis TaxID=31220 RepID=UPI0038B42044